MPHVQNRGDDFCSPAASPLVPQRRAGVLVLATVDIF